ncbi:MAG: cobyrinate a,c-diamide synthase [Granulosicoccus sp.]|nr:cobyrinate a,c-diamide synthase [Granulosicoccus sp.]
MTEAAYFVSAPWRSSGKTIVTVGLAAAARQKQIAVQTFKKGPDYIDPRWLAAASRQPCYNLDLHQQNHEEIVSSYRHHAQSSQLCLVEGTMGLHDGIATDGSDSNAAIARLLDLPVLLAVDCRGMHRTVAALLKGIEQFDPELRFAGVILNRIRSDRHAQKIEQAIAAHTDMRLLGILPDREDLAIAEQELGLTPTLEDSHAGARIDVISDVVQEYIDLDALFPPVIKATQIQRPVAVASTPARVPAKLRIGLAHDEAFHFYYQDDLDYFASLGVELVRCSPCKDAFPTGLDGLWIGGGFPERHVEKLSGNKAFYSALHQEIEAGLPVHAECGGLMYLCRSIQVENKRWPMCGVIEADVSLSDRPVGRGYMQLTTETDHEMAIFAHEFHHSSITFDSPPDYTYRVTRGHGVDGQHDGVAVHNVIAGFAHFRQSQKTPWIDWFLSRIQAHKNNPVYQHV